MEDYSVLQVSNSVEDTVVSISIVKNQDSGTGGEIRNEFLSLIANIGMLLIHGFQLHHTNSQAPAASHTSGGLFGSSSNAAQAPSAGGGGGLFGSTPAPAFGGSLFGSNTSSTPAPAGKRMNRIIFSN